MDNGLYNFDLVYCCTPVGLGVCRKMVFTQLDAELGVKDKGGL